MMTLNQPHFQDDAVTLYHGDCLDVLRSDTLGYSYLLGYNPPFFPDSSVDSVVTDPPYGIGFMGKVWDHQAIREAVERDHAMAGRVAHSTVKPLDLMRWLVRLVTPPGGTVLEPFAGSGTTAEACILEGFKCIAIEREADYLPLIVQRINKPLQVGFDFGGVA